MRLPAGPYRILSEEKQSVFYSARVPMCYRGTLDLLEIGPFSRDPVTVHGVRFLRTGSDFICRMNRKCGAELLTLGQLNVEHSSVATAGRKISGEFKLSEVVLFGARWRRVWKLIAAFDPVD